MIFERFSEMLWKIFGFDVRKLGFVIFVVEENVVIVWSNGVGECVGVYFLLFKFVEFVV